MSGSFSAPAWNRRPTKRGAFVLLVARPSNVRKGENLKMQTRSCLLAISLVAAVFLLASAVFAQSSMENGKLKIHVSPKQAYVFVDGKAIRDGSQTMDLAAGSHRVAVYNYGYVPQAQQVHVGAGETTRLSVALQSIGDKVSGPFADIEFKGDPRAAVLVNGSSPKYFVGHVDEFNWDWIWHQRLLVKPGTYDVTITRNGDTIWSSPVTTKAGEKTIVYLNDGGKTETKPWKVGLSLPPQPRFHAGIASATIPLASVSARLSTDNRNLTCGQPTKLQWSTRDAVDTSISGIGEVPEKGDRTVTPNGPSTYVLTAKGPGGVSTQTVTVAVKTQPSASLSISQPGIQFHKVGDHIVQQDSATLHWSVSNASSAKLEPLNTDAMSGSRTITITPKQTADGPVNENLTYTLTATNACGGTVTKTATLHISGSIEPPPATSLASLFYPTAYPTKHHPKVGLVATEKMVLSNVASEFKSYGVYDHDATLMVVGHADVRGAGKYNETLSERRAQLVKDTLIADGVPADKIQSRAVGKTQQLDEQAVQELQVNNTEQPAAWMKKHKRATWLAYNRRADILLEPNGKPSIKMFPNQSADAHVLWQRPIPTLKKVEQASRPSETEQAKAIRHSSAT